MKRTIRINFTDWWDGFNKTDNYIYRLLEPYYEIELCEDPDYLFYSCFGTEFVKYDCIRIFATGENVRPDFNLCDYAMGFDYLQFEDRYIRFPYLYYYYNRDTYFAQLFERNLSWDDFERKKKFCNFVYSNAKVDSPRNKIFEALSAYKKVDSGGRHLNNIGGPVEDKVLFQQQYRFSIAVENSSTRGYNTEKIVQAFAAHTVPIYWGDPIIGRIYNTAAFINGNECESIEELVLKVKMLEEHPEQIYDMLCQPVFVNDWKCGIPDVEEAAIFLKKIFEQDLKCARRRSNYQWTQRIEDRYKNEWNRDGHKSKITLKTWISRVIHGGRI